MGDAYDEKLCEEKHKGVESKHCDVIRRVEILERYREDQIEKKNDRNYTLWFAAASGLFNILTLAVAVWAILHKGVGG